MKKTDNERVNRVRYYNLHDNGKCESALKESHTYFKSVRYK